MKLKELLKQRWAAYSIATCSAVVLYLLLSNIGVFFSWIGSLWGIISPIVIGLIFSYIMNPVSNYFENHLFRKVRKEESRHACSVILTVGCVIVLLTLLILMVVPAITGSITSIINNYDVYYNNIQDLMNNVNQLLIKLGIQIEQTQVISSVTQYIGTFFSNLKNNLSSVVGKIGDIGSSLFNILIGFIMAVYFLMAKKNMKNTLNRFRSAFSDEEKVEINNQFWLKCNQIFIQYIGCSVLDACIIGASNAIFMTIAGMQNITLISLIVGITNLLPTFGPLIGGATGAILLLLTKPVHALYFLIFTVILQILDGYVIKPKLFSNSLGLSPVLTLVSIILGGKMFGILGILLGIPVVAVAYMLYEEKLLPWFRMMKENKRLANESKIDPFLEDNDEEKKEATL